MAMGSILFMKSPSLTSKIIRFVSKGDYSHVCISLNSNNSVVLSTNIFERLQVKINKAKNYKVVDVDLTNEQRLQLLDFLMSKYDAKYDYFYVLGLGLKFLGLIKNSFHFDRRNRYMCSEILDECFKAVGIDLIPDKKDGDVSPSELARALNVI